MIWYSINEGCYRSPFCPKWDKIWHGNDRILSACFETGTCIEIECRTVDHNDDIDNPESM